MSTTMNVNRNVSANRIQRCACCLSACRDYTTKALLEPTLSIYFEVKAISVKHKDTPESMFLCTSCIVNAEEHIENDTKEGIIEDPKVPKPTCPECKQKAKYCGESRCTNIKCDCEEDCTSCDFCSFEVCEECTGGYYEVDDGYACQRCYDDGDCDDCSHKSDKSASENEDESEEEPANSDEDNSDKDSDSDENSIKKRKRNEVESDDGDKSCESPLKKQKSV